MRLQNIEIETEHEIDFIVQITGVRREVAKMILESYALVDLLDEQTPEASKTFKSIGKDIADRHREAKRNSSR